MRRDADEARPLQWPPFRHPAPTRRAQTRTQRKRLSRQDRTDAARLCPCLEDTRTRSTRASVSSGRSQSSLYNAEPMTYWATLVYVVPRYCTQNSPAPPFTPKEHALSTGTELRKNSPPFNILMLMHVPCFTVPWRNPGALATTAIQATKLKPADRAILK